LAEEKLSIEIDDYGLIEREKNIKNDRKNIEMD
jgi:hypothetical protein